MWFFKTGPGQYGESDVFIGVSVPDQHSVARAFRALPVADTWQLLKSKIHEERLTALFILVWKFAHADESTKKTIYERYLRNTRYVNNWDLVDSSAREIVGCYLLERPERERKRILDKLARSKLLWDRRVAVIATAPSITRGNCTDILRLSDALLDDKHDLIHKAVGWMLRDVGDRCGMPTLERYLRKRLRRLPRTTLRYSIEHMPTSKRERFLHG
jgi:3-methyladenine DNA glycosylase AlkD